jgi:hypothetical protein
MINHNYYSLENYNPNLKNHFPFSINIGHNDTFLSNFSNHSIGVFLLNLRYSNKKTNNN